MKIIHFILLFLCCEGVIAREKLRPSIQLRNSVGNYDDLNAAEFPDTEVLLETTGVPEINVEGSSLVAVDSSDPIRFVNMGSTSVEAIPQHAAFSAGSAGNVVTTSLGASVDIAVGSFGKSADGVGSAASIGDDSSTISGSFTHYSTEGFSLIGSSYQAPFAAIESAKSSSLLQLEVTTSGSDPSSLSSNPESSGALSGIGGPSALSMQSAGTGADGTSLSLIGTSSSAQLFTGSSAGQSSSPSGGGGGGGMAVASGSLGIIVFLLVFGCLAEYYIANMHKLDGEKYVEYLHSQITGHVDQLKEFLAHHPELLEKLKEHQSGIGMEDEEVEDKAKIEEENQDQLLISRLTELPIDFSKFIDSIVPAADFEVHKQDEHTTKGSGSDTGLNSPSSKTNEEEEESGDEKDSKSKKQSTEKDDPKAARKKAMENIQKASKEIGPKILGGLYAVYSAIPSFISKHFTFYFLLILIAIFTTSAQSQ